MRASWCTPSQGTLWPPHIHCACSLLPPYIFASVRGENSTPSDVAAFLALSSSGHADGDPRSPQHTRRNSIAKPWTKGSLMPRRSRWRDLSCTSTASSSQAAAYPAGCWSYAYLLYLILCGI
jgi:hypothetical protein